jgi:diguanylate cyclase (GGDEF)-like protein/PAS domain S-box-containing protein
MEFVTRHFLLPFPRQAMERGLFAIAFLCLLWNCGPPEAISGTLPREVSIGVETIRSPKQTLAFWKPTADYLTRAIPGYQFKIEPLDAAGLSDAVAQDRLDFILTNPSHYVYLEAKHRITRIATLVRMVEGHPLKEFGGVIFVRANRKDIHGLPDLKHRKIAAAGENWLGAYQSQAAELLQLGIDINKDAQLSFTGEPQDRVVHDVANGNAEAGFIRTGVLEELAKEGKLKLSDFRVLGLQASRNFPFALSTRLYPEWPFSVSTRTPPELSGKVVIALLSLTPNSEAAKKGMFYGWAIPANYQSVHELMKLMGFPPYNKTREFSLQDVVQKYQLPIIASLLMGLLLSLFAILRFFSLNRTVCHHVELATRRNIELENEVAARKKAEEEIRLSASVFENSNDGILIANADNIIVDVNQAFSIITGYSKEEMLGKNPRVLQSGRHESIFYQSLWEQLSKTGHWRGELWNRRKNGEFYMELLDITAVKNLDGETTHYVAIFSDITTLNDSQKKLEHMAHFDALTQLPNRALLADRLEQSIAHADRANHLLAVCFLDLDDFKPINDKHGHQIGDKLLINVAARLKHALRNVDSVARLGGDEFVLLITNLNDTQELELVLSRVMAGITVPHLIDSLDLRISASVGVTLYPLDDSDADTLLRHADQAMYMAKRSGRNQHHLFDAEEDRQAQCRSEQIGEIRLALQNREFALYYQPKVNMRSGEVVGLEALIRWNHPTRGLVYPGEFLPLIESTDFVVEIGNWVIEEAWEQLRIWSAEGINVPVSVNIDAHHLQHPDFVRHLQGHFARHPEMAPSRLELEILESAALEDVDGMCRLIHACQAMGVRFALDDFGTGYSSLSYLKRLPIDTLKIDQSFIRDLLNSPEDLAVIEGVVSLANVFNRDVIAEGVETVEHGAMLMRLGCDLAQGYGISRPMPAADVPGWIGKFTPDPLWTLWAEVPWDYADFPLLVAQSDHTRWVRTIERLINGVTPKLDPAELNDHRRCRFGCWYYAQGRTRYGNLPQFIDIEPIHIRVHQIGLEISQLMDKEEAGAAKALLPELHRMRDQIQGLLAILQSEVATKY